MLFLLHGFHSVCAITLALTGTELSKIMDHVGWPCQYTAVYYLHLAKVLNLKGTSALLVFKSDTDVINPWQNMNELKHFVSAIPSKTLDKRFCQGP